MSSKKKKTKTKVVGGVQHCVEYIFPIDRNNIAVKIKTTKRFISRNSCFKLKYESLDKTAVKSIDPKSDPKSDKQLLFTQQNQRKDSFNRFGDDLTELLLSYLSLKQKFSFECVCKQWKGLIYNRQLFTNAFK